jgi:hypothetical protein
MDVSDALNVDRPERARLEEKYNPLSRHCSTELIDCGKNDYFCAVF